MKRIFFLCLAIAVYQNWKDIDNYLYPKQDYSDIPWNSVKFFSSTWCEDCQRTRDFFTKNNVPYREFSIDTSQQALAEYNKLQGQGVPMVVIEGQIIQGYQPANMRRELQEL